MEIDFEELFEEKILRRGYVYYIEDLVHKVTKNGENYKSLVDGTKTYQVEIEMDNDGNIKHMHCDCPYATENNCKHMAALLYYLKNDGKLDNNQNLKSKENYASIINKISETEIKEFLLEKLNENIELQNEFRSYFLQYFGKISKSEYERRISQSINQAIGRKGFIEYDETYKLSKPMYDYIQEAYNLINQKEYGISFWIVSLILKKLPDIPIDDSDGTISYIVSECVELIEELLETCEDVNVVNEIFNWIIKSLKDDDSYYYSSELEELLDKYFTEDRYISERLKIIDDKINKFKQESNYHSEYETEINLKTKINLLYQLGKNDEALKVIKDNIYYDSIRKMLIDIEVNAQNMDEVERLLNGGLENALKRDYFGIVVQYIDELLTFYSKLNQKEKYKILVEEALFKYTKADFNYYKKLKELYTQNQWENIRNDIISKLENIVNDCYNDNLKKIYIEEKYYDKLYNSVIKMPMFEAIVKYEKYLKQDFEEQLLEKYKNIVNENAKFAGKNNYQYVTKILKHMKTLKNGDQIVKNIVEEYKIKYFNRRLMLEELNKVYK